jgi:ADP-ribose pyrophosphatase
MARITRRRFQADDVEIVEREAVFQGYFRVDRYRLRHRRHDGGWADEVTREIFERGHAAALLPYDPDEDTVVLIEQIRVGAIAADWTPWMVEIAAGIIEPGEKPEEVARRETVEECGATVSQILPIMRYMPSPGAVSETVHLYLGRVDSTALPALAGRPDEGEDILVTPVPWAEAAANLSEGVYTNATAIIALQWLALNRERVRRLWSKAAK